MTAHLRGPHRLGATLTAAAPGSGSGKELAYGHHQLGALTMTTKLKNTPKPAIPRPSSVVYESNRRGRITPRFIQFLRDHNASDRLIQTAIDGMADEEAARGTKTKKPIE